MRQCHGGRKFGAFRRWVLFHCLRIDIDQQRCFGLNNMFHHSLFIPFYTPVIVPNSSDPSLIEHQLDWPSKHMHKDEPVQVEK